MKLIQKIHSKRGAYILGAIIMLFSCNKDILENTVIEETKIQGTFIGYVTESDVPDVINTITSFTGKASLSKTDYGSKAINYKKAHIGINRILKVKNREAITNYSFSIIMEDAPDNEFYNLAVNEDANGNIKSPYVIKYIVDADALETFLLNDKDFHYFKGTKHVISFNSFFNGTDVFSKSSSGDCPDGGTGINNTGGGANGDFYDIPNDHPVKTNPYNYHYYYGDEAFTLNFNTYNALSGGGTSYGDNVRDEQFPVSVLTPQGYTTTMVNATITGGSISPPYTTPYVTGLIITASGPVGGGGNTGCSLTITRFYSNGSSTVDNTFFPCSQSIHLDKQSSSGKLFEDCPGMEGEVGVNTFDLAISVRDRLGLLVGTVENSWLLKNATYDQIRALDYYLDSNANAQSVPTPEAKAFANLAVIAWRENFKLGTNNEVDFEEKRINGIKLDSSLTNCLESMILNLMLDDFPYSETAPKTELIKKVFQTLGLSSQVGIDLVTTYKLGNIGSKNGETSQIIYNLTTNKFEATITISQNLVNNGTKLALAKTVLHESIHAYLKYTAKEYPTVFTNPNGDFSTLLAAWQVHNNENYAHHVYMANLIEDIATNVGNFVSEQYSYPSPFSSGNTLAHYEAVAWSGIALLSDPTGTSPYIENPVFVQNYPDMNDRINIVNIFNKENDITLSTGNLPLMNNKCN